MNRLPNPSSNDLPNTLSATDIGIASASHAAKSAASIDQDSTAPSFTNPSSHLMQFLQMHSLLPTLPDAFSWMFRTLVVALFLLTFVLQPFVIPSESMEHTLLVGDFLLMNKQVYAPSNPLSRALLPYQDVQRGDIVVFHFPQNPRKMLVKRVVGIAGDRLRIDQGHVWINEQTIPEPYAAFEPIGGSSADDHFPATIYTNPNVDPQWWKQLRTLTHNGELVVPQGEYFVMGDNRNHSNDSRSWGLVQRDQIVARPLLIYFSLLRPSSTDVQEVMDDRLGHDRELSARLTGFARWKRIFTVVH